MGEIMKINFNTENIKKLFAASGILAMVTYTGITTFKSFEKNDNKSTNKIVYVAPVGYHIEEIDGNIYAIRNEQELEYENLNYKAI